MGFNVLIGSPPWEQVELKEREWFSLRDSDIVDASTGAGRKRMIQAHRETITILCKEYSRARHHVD